MPGPGGRRRVRAGRFCLLLGLLLMAIPATATAQQVPAGFDDRVVVEGLDSPTAIRFAPGGEVFITEQSGLVKVLDDINDPTPEVFADLRREVWYGADRGLLGLAIDPDYATNGNVYVSYSYAAPIGHDAPYYGDYEELGYPDFCSAERCDVSGRVERLTLGAGNNLQRTVLVADEWCEESASHSIGTLQFDDQGRLYAGGGDGADYNNPDYGQAIRTNEPDYVHNTCGDPPGSRGVPLSPPDAEGGALRSQDLRTTSDPLGLSGTIIRIDKDTGAGLPGNPGYDPDHPFANEGRILAYGLRNPFRFGLSPTGKLWLGDVGWRTTEELNSFSTSANQVFNFGWPCYEGTVREPEYDQLDLDMCEDLYADEALTGEAVTEPAFSYSHFATSGGLYPGDPCPVPGDGSASSGVEFYDGTSFPAAYEDALFFTDYARHCIWMAPADEDGEPRLQQISAFAEEVATPVDLQVGPDGALYYVNLFNADFTGGEIRRIQYSDGNRTPVAVAEATPTEGDLDLEVQFEGGNSTDPDPGDADALEYDWDLDGDGEFDDSQLQSPTRTYTARETIQAELKVTDPAGLSDFDRIRIDAGNSSPVPVITAPSDWATGEALEFSGSADDPDEGPLDEDGLSWSVNLHHCVAGGGCHVHHQSTLSRVDEIALPGPDHYYPAYLSVRLTATDSDGLAKTTTLELQPRTVALEANSQPGAAEINLNGTIGSGRVQVTAIEGSQNSVGAAAELFGPDPSAWCAWSNGGDRVHTFEADTDVTLTASYCGPEPPANRSPAELGLSSDSVEEQQMVGTDVGELSAGDADGDTVAFALVRGPGDDDNDEFRLDGSTLETATILHRRDGATRSVRVRVDDGRGGTDEVALTIRVVALDLGLERLALRVPDRRDKLIDDGVRARLRCAIDCRVEIKLLGRGRLARLADLEGPIGDGAGRLVAGRKQWLTATLDRRAERRLGSLAGKRVPRVVARFEATRVRN